MKRVTTILLLMSVLLLGMTGCKDGLPDNPESLNRLLDETISSTQKALEEHNIKEARDIWGKISEYGIKAQEMDKTELADDLNKMAAAYAYLIRYLETGDQEELNTFNENFEGAVQTLQEYMQNS